MNVRKPNRTETTGIVLFGLFLILLSQSTVSFSQGPNNRNVTVDTTVNVTGSVPIIELVAIQNSIALSAGSTRFVTCNVSILDYNGFADLDTVQATFFHTTASSFGSADDNNTHYTNASCDVIAGQTDGNYANYTCGFPVTYYAQNGTWNCTAGVNDSINLATNNSNLTAISALLALNVTTLIDYGDLAMGDMSENQTANVSNIGNVNINVSVEGYGLTIGDGLSFNCTNGNLTVDLQHFAANSTADYATKQALASSRQAVLGLMVNKTVNVSDSFNTTYWELYLDPLQNAYGICNGSIIFQAEAS